MRIVVNHLTRMQPGYICVAGIDLASGKHVRPVLETRLSSRLLARNRGPFDIGAIVDLGTASPMGRPPETEDHRFNQWKVTRVKDSVGADFWELLGRVARPGLRDVFGDALQQRDRSCTVEVGQGRASLGCLRATRPQLAIDSAGKIRLTLDDGRYRASLSVADLRLYGTDYLTPRRDRVEHVAARIEAGVGVILSVGLSRPFLKPGDKASRHWLQVNNIHLEDDPLWTERAC
jgi:hypothetical protein